MRAIDADALTEDCKRYLGTLNPDKDGKECTRIHWLIGVLENAPTIDPDPCEDAVSRRRLLNDLKELIAAWKKYPVMTEQIKGVEVAIGYVERIPSVTPKRKTGQWIYPYETTKMVLICSECGAHGRGNFCSNCGSFNGGIDVDE